MLPMLNRIYTETKILHFALRVLDDSVLTVPAWMSEEEGEEKMDSCRKTRRVTLQLGLLVCVRASKHVSTIR